MTSTPGSAGYLRASERGLGEEPGALPLDAGAVEVHPARRTEGLVPALLGGRGRLGDLADELPQTVAALVEDLAHHRVQRLVRRRRVQLLGDPVGPRVLEQAQDPHRLLDVAEAGHALEPGDRDDHLRLVEAVLVAPLRGAHRDAGLVLELEADPGALRWWGAPAATAARRPPAP